MTMLQQVNLYGMLAAYYKSKNPELCEYYHREYRAALKQLANWVESYGDPFQMTAMKTENPAYYQQQQAYNGYYGYPQAPTHISRREYTKVRALHAAPNAPSVDIFVNGELFAKGVSFKDMTDYVKVMPGEYTIEIYTTDGQTLVLQQRVRVPEGAHITLAAVENNGNGIELLPILDEPFVPPGKAKVRAIHLSPDSPAVDVAVQGGNVVFSNISYKDVTPYIEVEPGSLPLEVRVAGTNNVVLEIPAMVRRGEALSIAVVGLSQGEPAINYIVLKDN
ncbi:DUF4397 domain-containing protein [Longirhabdus pacifica]|uniref:DUF4397 domain-containing protein n=1 Tax=Longirhabdus pacifica TaxID=2305227 RepID=UPI001F0BA499|nr:DUF4397 domain-containing protein [Longirhabdus pacifica]